MNYMSKNLLFLAAVLTLSACNTGNGGISDFEMQHGIGPVTEKLDPGEIDPAKVEQGMQLFESQCIACHTLDARIAGPALRNVVRNREYEFVVNYILNPTEMAQEHPIGRDLREQYGAAMPENNLTKEDALAILEYLRAAYEGFF